MSRLLKVVGLLLILAGLDLRSQSGITGNIQVYNGQQAITGTAAALANQPLKTICIKALHANTIPVYVGNASVTTGNGMELQPDQSYCQAVVNANQFYIVATTTGASVSWLGSN